MGEKRFNSPATSATKGSAEVGEDPAPPELMTRLIPAHIRGSTGPRTLTSLRSGWCGGFARALRACAEGARAALCPGRTLASPRTKNLARLAQRQSTVFTWQGSLVRIQQRAPQFWCGAGMRKGRTRFHNVRRALRACAEGTRRAGCPGTLVQSQQCPQPQNRSGHGRSGFVVCVRPPTSRPSCDPRS